MKLYERQQIFSLNVAKLIQFIFESGYKCTLGECFRPVEMAKIYAKEGKGIVNSLHCDRLAIDINLFSSDNKFLIKTEDHAQFGQYWKSLHKDNIWGGDATAGSFYDGNHYAMRD